MVSRNLSFHKMQQIENYPSDAMKVEKSFVLSIGHNNAVTLDLYLLLRG